MPQHPNPNFESNDYSDTGIWARTNNPSFADDLFNKGTAIDGGTGSAAFVTKSPGVVVSGDTAITKAIWWKGTDMTSVPDIHAFLLAQHDSTIKRQFFMRVLAGSVEHGQLEVFVFDGGTSTNSINSLSSNRFDVDIWYLFLVRANSSALDIFFATVDNPTIAEVGYVVGRDSQNAGTGFSIMGGATSDLITGEDPETPANDQLFGLNARPRIWKNKFLTNSQLQSFATQQIKLINGTAKKILLFPDND